LAGENKPTVATVGYLFEKAMNELGIELPDVSAQPIKVLKDYYLVQSSDFLELATTALRQNSALLIRRIFCIRARVDLASGWHLVTAPAQWEQLLDEGPPRTIYSVVLDHELPRRGCADSQFQKEALDHFNRLGDLMVALRPQNNTEVSLHSFEWMGKGWTAKGAELGLQATREEIRQFFEQHRDLPCAIGRDIFVWQRDIRTVTAYTPDRDGVIRSGMY
jgi:hypothetical protein